MKSVRRPGPASIPSDAPPPLLRALSEARTDVARAGAYLALARHYRHHSLPLAASLAHEALDAALRAAAPDATVEVLSGLAFIEVAQGRQEKAFEHTALALDLAREHGLHHLEARVRNNRAIARLNAGDVLGTRRDLLDAQGLARTLGDVIDQAHVYVNLAYLENVSGHYPEALHQLSLLENLLPDLPEQEQPLLRSYLYENSALTYLNIARQAHERDRPDVEAQARASAYAAIQASYRMMAVRPDVLMALTVEAHAARLALLEGDLERAHEHAAASLNHHHELGQQSYLDAHLAMAEVSAARGHSTLAHQHYQNALELARGQGRARETQEVLRAIARLYEQEGNLAGALETYRDALERAHRTLERLTHIEQRNEDLARELRQARAEASTWQDSVRRAEALARQDPLTGLLNRRGLQDALAELDDESGPFLLVMFDIDHFKAVNDRYSHVVGDAVLQSVAGQLIARLPDDSLLARYGGEEFVLVQEGVDPTEVPTLVEGLRQAIEAHDWSALLPGTRLTISIGYTLTGDTDDQALRAAFEQADEHLYRAKRAGRNQVYPPVLVLR